MVKVSVIIPLYNGKKYIADTLKSVFDQNFKDYEVIVVNDGSTDHPEDSLKPFMDRIKYVSQENSGCPAGGKNAGIRLAQGKYLAFLDQDDLWEKEKLHRQVEIMDENDQVGMVANNTLVFASETGQELGSAWNEAGKYKEIQVKKRLLEGNFIVTCSAVMVRADILKKIGDFDEKMKLADDYEMWHRISKKYQIGLLPDVLTRWRLNTASLSHSHEKLLRDLVYFYRQVLSEEDLLNEEKEVVKSNLAMFDVRLANLLLSKGEYNESRELYQEGREMGNGTLPVKIMLTMMRFCPGLARKITGWKLKLTHPVMTPTLGIDL